MRRHRGCAGVVPGLCHRFRGLGWICNILGCRIVCSRTCVYIWFALVLYVCIPFAPARHQVARPVPADQPGHALSWSAPHPQPGTRSGSGRPFGHACICTHAYMHANAFICVHMHAYAYAYALCTCMHMHMRAYACTCTRIHAYAIARTFHVILHAQSRNS